MNGVQTWRVINYERKSIFWNWKKATRRRSSLEDWYLPLKIGQRNFDVHINHFMSLVFFLYPLKTSKNQRFSDVFRGYRKRLVVWNELIQSTNSENKCQLFALTLEHSCFKELTWHYGNLLSSVFTKYFFPFAMH